MDCANRMQSRACSRYAEVKPSIDEVNGLREPNAEPSLLVSPAACVESNYYQLQKIKNEENNNYISDDGDSHHRPGARDDENG